jgi:predicted outer membrane repeat protein
MNLSLILLVLALAAVHPSVSELVLHVDDVKGIDNATCLDGGTQPCATLNYAIENLRNNTSIFIDVPSVTHTVDNIISALSNITISGSRSLSVSTIDCRGIGGFAFYNVSEITLVGVKFSNCSAVRNSTSFNNAGGNINYLVGVYMHMCENVIMKMVHVTNSPGVGAVMLSVTGNVNISHSNFTSNGYLVVRANSSTYDDESNMTKPGGGGLVIELALCPPGTSHSTCNDITSSAVRFPLYQNVVYNIDNCNFVNNTADTPNFQDYALLDYPNASNYNAIGRGGGLSFFIRGNSSNIAISISHSRFERNHALYGGGMFVELHHHPVNVTVCISDTDAVSNDLPYNSKTNYGPGGGGLRFAHFVESDSGGNTLKIDRCRFKGNKAYFGAGASILFSAQPSVNRPFLINNTTFERNVARLGAAMDLHSSTLAQANLVLKDIVVSENSLEYVPQGQIAFIHGEGIVYSFNLCVHMEGTNTFVDNGGSAITVLNGIINFGRDVQVKFLNNRSFRGGGLSLLGSSTAYIHPGSFLLFENNTVSTRGGAIFHTSLGNRALLDSAACPIARGNRSMSWNEASLTFVNNVAKEKRGHAIYVYSFYPCVEHSLDDLNNTFHWAGFSYTCTIAECNNSNSQVSGDGTIVKTTASHVTAFPGENIHLPLTFYDDMHQTADVILYGIVSSTNDSYPVTFINSTVVEVTGQPTRQEHANLIIHSSGDVILGITLDLQIVRCPPGWKRSSREADAVCICIEGSLPGLICNPFNFSTTLRRNTWVGFVYGSGTEVGECPHGYCSPSSLVLTGFNHYNHSTLDDAVCGPQNRTGVLCGRCKPGFGISLSPSSNFQCVPCDSTVNVAALFIWLFLEFLPLNIVLLLFIVFKINLLTGWNGLLYTFLFYFQVVATTPAFEYQFQTPSTSWKDWYSVLLYVNQFLSNLWNLRFFSAFAPAKYFCLHKGITAQGALTGTYFTIVLWPLVVYLCLGILHHLYYSGKCCTCFNTCIRHFSRALSKCRPTMPHTSKSSYISSFCSFFVLAYARVVILCFELTSKMDIVNGSGERAVFTLNGSAEWFGDYHAPYAVPVFLCTIVTVFIPTLILLSFPLFPSMSAKLHIRDVRPFSWINKGLSSTYMKFIFDIFQGCFEDSTRCFAAFYLVYRLFFIFIWSITSNFMVLGISQLVLALVFLTLHSLFQPFTSKMVNMLNSLVFANLILVLLLSTFSIFVDIMDVSGVTGSVNDAVKAFTIIALYFPHAIVFIYFVRQVCVGFRACCKKTHKDTSDTSNHVPKASGINVIQSDYHRVEDSEWDDVLDLLDRDSEESRRNVYRWAGKGGSSPNVNQNMPKNAGVNSQGSSTRNDGMNASSTIEARERQSMVYSQQHTPCSLLKD